MTCPATNKTSRWGTRAAARFEATRRDAGTTNGEHGVSSLRNINLTLYFVRNCPNDYPSVTKDIMFALMLQRFGEQKQKLV